MIEAVVHLLTAATAAISNSRYVLFHAFLSKIRLISIRVHVPNAAVIEAVIQLLTAASVSSTSSRY